MHSNSTSLLLVVLLTTTLCLAPTQALSFPMVLDETEDFFAFFQGFTKGFIKEDLNEIKNCALEGTDMLNKFKSVCDQFMNANPTEGLKQLIEMLQLVPSEFGHCAAIRTTVEKIIRKSLKVVDIAALLKTIGVNMMFRAFEIMGELSRGTDGLMRRDYFQFGFSLGKSLDLLISE